MKKTLRIIKKFFPIFIISILALTSGCSQKPSPGAVVLTVDDSKIRMSEMQYYVMLAEMQGQLYASYLGNGNEYWDMKNDDGTTMRDTTKEVALDNAIKYQLFYQLALQEGYNLTETDKKTDQSQADSILKNIGADELNKVGLNDNNLLEIQHKITLATKYYNHYMEDLGVDEDAIKAKFDLNDYKQYDIEYIYGGKDNKDEITALLDKAENAEDLTTLTENTDLNSGKLSFLAGEDTFGEEENLEDIITSMKVGEVKGLIETVKGYYIIKLDNNTSTTKYDDAIKKAVEDAETKAFDTAFADLKKEHTITVKNSVWDKVEVGKSIITASNN